MHPFLKGIGFVSPGFRLRSDQTRTVRQSPLYQLSCCHGDSQAPAETFPLPPRLGSARTDAAAGFASTLTLTGGSLGRSSPGHVTSRNLPAMRRVTTNPLSPPYTRPHLGLGALQGCKWERVPERARVACLCVSHWTGCGRTDTEAGSSPTLRRCAANDGDARRWVGGGGWILEQICHDAQD